MQLNVTVKYGSFLCIMSEHVTALDAVLFLSVVESMFTQDLDGVYQKMIDAVYRETSMHLLKVLHTKYKFMDHLKVRMNYECQ